jgi:glycosyltransferase involved in cell wall biosynthesis
VSIAIAMATFEPDLDLFQAQVESIVAQTRDDWICLVSDDCSAPERFEQIAGILARDTRFTLSRAERRRGFYLNFERALGMVPQSARYVLLCDQDDRWHPDKLDVLCREIGSAQLIYSDARIVDRTGHVIADTFWGGRQPRHSDFPSLLITNTVPGAASMFRRELLAAALPFPSLPGAPYHDHWIALVAAASGEIAYLPRPLYDYVQHAAAVLGHARTVQPGKTAGRPGRRLRLPGRRWGAAYENEYRRLILLAEALMERCGPPAGRRRRLELERFLATESSPRGIAWALHRWALALSRGEAGSGERVLAAALLWRWLSPAGRQAAAGSQR